MHPVDNAIDEWHAERPDLDPSPIAIFGRLRRTAELARRSMREYLKPFGLAHNTFDVLANLRRGGAPYRKTPSELARTTLLSSGAITGPLDTLEAQGLITRAPHPHDRRVMYAELTPKGLDIIDQAMAVHLANEASALDGLLEGRRDDIVKALADLEATLRSNLE